MVILVMSESSFDGGGTGGGGGGDMSDDDEFDAPAAPPPKKRRTRLPLSRSGHSLTPGCAFLVVDGTVRQPPGNILDRYAGLDNCPPHFYTTSMGVGGIVFFSWFLRRVRDAVNDDHALELQERGLTKIYKTTNTCNS